MRRLLASAAVFGLGLVIAPAAGATVAEEATTSVVAVETSDSEGVGFALDHPRRVVTSSELVGDAASVTLTRDDGSSASADVLAVDSRTGLAILRSSVAIQPLSETETAAQADDAVIAVAVTPDEEVLEQQTSLAGSVHGDEGWRMEVDDTGDYAGAPVLDDAGDVTAIVGAGAYEGRGIPVARAASVEADAGVGELFPERHGSGSAPFVVALASLVLLCAAAWLIARLTRPRMRRRFALAPASAASNGSAPVDDEPLVVLKNNHNTR